MSLNILTKDEVKPWLNVRMNQLCIQGALYNIPQPQINGDIIGIINGVTGEVACIPVPVQEVRHFHAYAYMSVPLIGAGNTTTYDIMVQDSPVTTNFTLLAGVVTVVTSGKYLIHVRSTIATNVGQVNCNLNINGVVKSLGYFWDSAPNNSSTFIQGIYDINAAETVKVSVTNLSAVGVATTGFMNVFLIKLSDL